MNIENREQWKALYLIRLKENLSKQDKKLLDKLSGWNMTATIERELRLEFSNNGYI